MSKTKPRILLSLLAVILCISIFPVTAFVSGGDYHDYELPPPESTEAEKTEEAETEYTGTVTTNGGNLNVRTGAGMDNKAFTQLANGTVVEVIGTDGDWIKILLPERVGYVHGKYLTISSTEKTRMNCLNRLPRYRPIVSGRLSPSLRSDIMPERKSCTAPAKILPSTIHR